MNQELITSEIKKIKKTVKTVEDKDISDDRAFELLSLYLFYYDDLPFENNYFDITSSITNGPNDGGIDFIHYDDENSKVVIGQCKYSSNFDLNGVISELNKMSSTVENFKKHNTGQYNYPVRSGLQNALDQLPEGNENNVEYCIFTIASFDQTKLEAKINNENNIYSVDMVNVKSADDFNLKISELAENISTVDEYKIKIDKAKNWLEYKTDNASGIVVNISSNSIIQMYNKYIDNGLLDMNIRKYVVNKTVDNGIKTTLDKERQNFWFYNNGIIIACKEYIPDGDNIKLYGFSIVNGGQTTNIIGKYKGSNCEEFFVPCKIISVSNNGNNMFTKIAEASNSQKPIFPRDLKANSPEMKVLQRWLLDENVYLEIKRGDKNKTKKYKIRNDEFGQLVYSFIYQSPGTARSGKKTIFENAAIYNKIYKQNYEKDANKKAFLLDLIKLYENYSEIELKLKEGTDVSADEKNVLKNGKYVIMSLLGMCYAIANTDLKKEDIINEPGILDDYAFTYGRFISNYTDDDYEDKLTELICFMLTVLDSTYKTAAEHGTTTSLSNLFKTDKKYRESLAVEVLKQTKFGIYKKNFPEWIRIFNR